MDITPESCIDHQSLEVRIRTLLRDLGFLTVEETYHTIMPLEIKTALQNMYNPTALYLRGRADGVAIHPTLNIAFEWEAKTHVSTRYHDMTLEALPVCHHIAKSQLGAECIYCYHNPHTGHEKGFWSYNLPAIRELVIPGRWTDSQRLWFEVTFRKFLPGDITIRHTESNKGSGDPFIIIDESTVNELVSWRDLILTASGGGD